MSDSLIQGLASAKEQTIREILNQICTRFPEIRDMAEEMLLAEEQKSQGARLSRETRGCDARGKRKPEYAGPLHICRRCEMTFDENRSDEEKCFWHGGTFDEQRKYSCF